VLFALQWLALVNEHQVVYGLPKLRRNGRTALPLTPLELTVTTSHRGRQAIAPSNKAIPGGRPDWFGQAALCVPACLLASPSEPNRLWLQQADDAPPMSWGESRPARSWSGRQPLPGPHCPAHRSGWGQHRSLEFVGSGLALRSTVSGPRPVLSTELMGRSASPSTGAHDKRRLPLLGLRGPIPVQDPGPPILSESLYAVAQPRLSAISAAGSLGS